MKLSLRKYKLIIFDWDGTLVDSLDSYKSWDKLYVQKFYGVDLPIEYFDELAKELKTVTTTGAESKYFRYLDERYGDGSTQMHTIWDNIYSLAPTIQAEVMYREDAPNVLSLLREKTQARLALATNAEMRDIMFYSSKDSKTARHLAPMDFFDTIVTSNHVKNLKPHPETFLKVIEQYDVQPAEVLIFEDSLSGVLAGRAAGADVVAIFADDRVKEHANYALNDWEEVRSVLEESVT